MGSVEVEGFNDPIKGLADVSVYLIAIIAQSFCRLKTLKKCFEKFIFAFNLPIMARKKPK